jgi:hypothetical protein
MNFSGSKQVIRPPQRGIFPLDHESECKSAMKVGFVFQSSYIYSTNYDIESFTHTAAVLASSYIVLIGISHVSGYGESSTS